MRISTYTFGCKVNQYETQAIEELLKERGHSIVPFGEICDVCIINTCSVTAESDRKAREQIRRAKKYSKYVALCGCYSQTHEEEAYKLLEADVVIGSANKGQIVDLVSNLPQKVHAVSDIMKEKEFEILPAGRFADRTRALLKVQDGCTNFCTYCIIPYARGRVRSMPLDNAIKEVKRLTAEGAKEIVLTGIEISSYGRDFKDNTDIKTLITEVCRAAGDCRIRLGSLEPRTIDEDFIEKIKDLKNLCPHFHLSMQSGSDTVLCRMGRKYDTERFYKSVKLLYDNIENCAITTDMIVGFPQESEEEFSQSLTFIKKCGFAKMHIFPYSRREGTKAYSMDGQLTKAEKSQRASVAIRVAEEMSREYNRSMVGKTLSVLFETEHNGMFEGHSENYLEVLSYGENLKGKLCNVKITDVKDGKLIGKINGAE